LETTHSREKWGDELKVPGRCTKETAHRRTKMRRCNLGIR